MASKRSSDDDGSMVPARRERGLPDDAALHDWAEELVARARAENVELTGEGGLLTGVAPDLGKSTRIGHGLDQVRRAK